MKKTIFQGSILIASFLAVWLAFSQLDFMQLFKVDKVAGDTEKELGDMLWETIERSETIIKNDSVNKNVNKLIAHIAEKNNIDYKKIKVHVVEKDEVNAFALPGDHLVVYTGLINSCENEAELAGVLGHEIAHLEKRHVMKKLVKEIGLSVLLSMTTGGHSQTVNQALKVLSSSAYDRKLESEADMASVDYLIKADIDPAPFADLLYKMSTDTSIPSVAYWISTHPESEERAKEIVNYIKGKKYTKKAVLTAAEWKFLKAKSEFNN